MKDAFELWWEWAQKPHESFLMIDADIHRPIMELSPEDRRDRAKVNPAVRQYQETQKCIPKPRRAPHDLLPATHRGAYHRLARARWALTYPLACLVLSTSRH